MPSPFPTIPDGVNPAAFPIPNLNWLERVKANNDRAAQKAGSIELVFDGDSITAGWQGPGVEVWRKSYDKFGAFDFGMSGDRTQQVLWRLSQGQMDGLRPKLIAIMIGTNNISSNTAEQIADGVKLIVGEYRKRCPDATVLLQAIFPRGHEPTDPVRTKIKDTNKIISGFADDKQVIYVDFWDKFLEPDGTLSPEIMPDYLHPNTKGYQIWADALQPVIDQFFPEKK